MIHDAGPQAEFGMQGRVGKINTTALIHSPKDIEIDLIQFWTRGVAIADLSETDCSEFNGCHQFELRSSLDQRAQSLSML